MLRFSLLATLTTLVLASPLTAADVTSFTLIDADSNNPIAAFDPIPAGATINLATLPSLRVNIRANVNGSVGSIRFQWSGAESGAVNENVAPYAMKGDSSGNFNAWTPTLGSYSVTATPYAGSNASGGTAGAALTRAFTVTDGGTTPPPPPPSGTDGDGSITITGERKQWHKVTLNLAGPHASETGTPNPFLDYRMTVTFSQGALSYAVPGYFAADGNAGQTSATSGTVWRAHLSPDTTGTWTYTVSFHTGSNVAVNGGGSTVAPYHGKTGTFTVSATDKSGRDFRGKGRLEYVNARYLRHKGNGEWFLKAGADAPENFLNNTEIDGTLNNGGTDHRHAWAPHVSDWQSGDPTWRSGLGKGVIGAINYLSGTGCNVFSFLTMNITGDSNDVWPYIAANQRTRMDCSKLDQWEVIFAHGTRKGMYLHFKTQETENNNLLDGGNLGTERKVYYRELIARFGHHLALNWNLGEENTQSTTQRQAMAQYFYDTDPYRHNVVLHTYPGQQESVYRPLLGSASKLTGVSVQTGWSSVHGHTRQWINESQAAGKIWVVANDEQGSANDGIPPQAGWPGYGGGGPSRPNLRHQTLWGNLMAGGAGVEAYFGYSHPDSDLTCRNWRSRADWWAMCNHALTFFRTHLPFNAMTSQDPLVGNSSSANNGRYCFAQTDEVYAIYLPAGQVSGSSLNLSGQTGTFTVRWYDPRNGGGLLTGSIASITGGGTRDVGNAPNNGSLDWVVLVERSDGTPPANQAPQVNAGPDRPVTMPNAATLSGTASDDGLPSGSSLGVSWTKQTGPGTVTFANANAAATTATFSAAGTYVLRLTATDGTLSAFDDMTVTVAAASGGALPSPWTSSDVGSVTPAGSASFTDDVFTVSGSGADIWNTADGFHFVSQPVTGDCTITARVIGIQNTNAWAKAGVMVRESLTADSKHGMMVITPGNGASFQRRATASGSSASTTTGGITAPHWVRVVRSGNTITGFRSADGSSWIQVGSQSITMATAVHIGLAVTSHNNGTLCTASFDQVSVDTAPEPPPPGGAVVLALNAGGSASGEFAADAQVSGGTTYTTGASILVSGVTDPAPEAVYRSERYGNFAYTLTGLTPGATYTLRLHFAEIYWASAGKRLFDVAVNGMTRLSGVDIYVRAGGKDRALVEELSVSADANGTVVITFITVVNNAKLSGLEVVEGIPGGNG